MMHARRPVPGVDTSSSRAQSATGSELASSVNGGKHLICLRDLTSKLQFFLFLSITNDITHLRVR